MDIREYDDNDNLVIGRFTYPGNGDPCPVITCGGTYYWWFKNSRKVYKPLTYAERRNIVEGTWQPIGVELPMTEISKKLSMCLLVSSREFAKQKPAKQTEILTTAGSEPIVFVDDFLSLKNKKQLLERLLAGEDVSMELEFNEITLSEEERTTLSAVQPILDRIGVEMTPPYTWVEPTETEKRNIAGYTFNEASIRRGSGYSCAVVQAKKIWDKASKFWATGKKDRFSEMSFLGGYWKTPSVSVKTLTLGCQKISRAEVEAIAKHYGWEPVTA
jgi:hypothetical protein